MATLLFNPANAPECTFDDVFLLPNNEAYRDQLLERITAEEKKEYMALLSAVEDARPSSDLGGGDRDCYIVSYIKLRQMELDLSELHQIGKSTSRDRFDFSPAGGLGNTPIITANMNNVTGKRMAEAIARVGGIGAIPQDKSDDELRSITKYLQERHPIYDTPTMVMSSAKIHELKKLLQKRSHHTAVVLRQNGELEGVISMSDIPQGINNDVDIDRYVRRDGVITAEEGISPLDAIALMQKQRVHYLVIMQQSRVIGVLTLADAAMRLRYHSNLSRNGGLRAMYTLGALNGNPIERVKLLLDLGVYDILLDTAHFDQGVDAYRTIESVRSIAENKGVSINLMAGNVVTRRAVRDILCSGAQFVKVGIGPGAMCSTRMETGVGRPQVSALIECVKEARIWGENAHIVADGGLKHPRDFAIALALGADYTMAGSLFTGTYESPSDLLKDERGNMYKENYGMASSRAATHRTYGREATSNEQLFRFIIGQRSEGISTSRVYVKPGKESVALLQHWLLDGVASSGSYAGASNLSEFKKYAQLGWQTNSGYDEGRPKETF